MDVAGGGLAGTADRDRVVAGRAARPRTRRMLPRWRRSSPMMSSPTCAASRASRAFRARAARRERRACRAPGDEPGDPGSQGPPGKWVLLARRVTRVMRARRDRPVRRASRARRGPPEARGRWGPSVPGARPAAPVRLVHVVRRGLRARPAQRGPMAPTAVTERPGQPDRKVRSVLRVRRGHRPRSPRPRRRGPARMTRADEERPGHLYDGADHRGWLRGRSLRPGHHRHRLDADRHERLAGDGHRAVLACRYGLATVRVRDLRPGRDHDQLTSGGS